MNDIRHYQVNITLVLFSSLWPIYIAQGFDDLFERKPMNGMMAS